MKLLMVVGIMSVLLTGCATVNHVKIVQSKSVMTVKHLEVKNGDTLLCDPSGCRVLE